MITNTLKIIPRYNEVDKMGYVYHANYVTYCHQARTELMRKLGICDDFLEQRGILIPVISFDIKFKKPVAYDEPITIKTFIIEKPTIKLRFNFEIFNSSDQMLSIANSTLVFVDKHSRKPIREPIWLANIFNEAFNFAEI